MGWRAITRNYPRLDTGKEGREIGRAAAVWRPDLTEPASAAAESTGAAAREDARGMAWGRIYAPPRSIGERDAAERGGGEER